MKAEHCVVSFEDGTDITKLVTKKWRINKLPISETQAYTSMHAILCGPLNSHVLINSRSWTVGKLV
jgi:hypothetical protein